MSQNDLSGKSLDAIANNVKIYYNVDVESLHFYVYIYIINFRSVANRTNVFILVHVPLAISG